MLMLLLDGFIWTMWDVKYTLCSWGYSIPHTFYMNYVGCKAGYTFSFSNGQKVFYMNYVGCKDRIIGPNTAINPAFYMNYVGCKVRLVHRNLILLQVLYELCGM